MTVRSCTSCACPDVRIVEPRDGLVYDVCPSCGHCERVNLAGDTQDPFDDAQARYYGSDSPVLAVRVSPFEAEALKTRKRIVSRILAPESAVLEVGPGAGAFLSWLSARGHHVSAVEQSPHVAEHLASRLSISVHVGEFEAVEIENGSVDAFCSFHVIEHVRNPARHLSRAFDLVKSGGCAFVATPNARSWEQRFFGSLSPNYDSAHLRVFSITSLRRMCADAGWTVREVHTPEYASNWLRVATKCVRRIRGEHEEDTAGKYAVGDSKALRLCAFILSRLSLPLRFTQQVSGGGSELFFVLSK